MYINSNYLRLDIRLFSYSSVEYSNSYEAALYSACGIWNIIRFVTTVLNLRGHNLYFYVVIIKESVPFGIICLRFRNSDINYDDWHYFASSITTSSNIMRTFKRFLLSPASSVMRDNYSNNHLKSTVRFQFYSVISNFPKAYGETKRMWLNFRL